MRLSATQQEILKLMAGDWELGSTNGIRPTWWLQKGGTGKGGERKDVRSTTFFALLDRGLIETASKKFPFAYYRLTEEGKRLVLL